MVSAGGREEAYQTDGFNHFTLRQLLQPLEQMASITQLTYPAPFGLFGSRTAKEEHRITRHSALWSKLLDPLAQDQLDVSKARKLENLTRYFDEQDLHNNHSKRRGWTPPPKGYAEEQLKNQKD